MTNIESTLENKSLRCEECGIEYDDDFNKESIDETGTCFSCDNKFECLL